MLVPVCWYRFGLLALHGFEVTPRQGCSLRNQVQTLSHTWRLSTTIGCSFGEMMRMFLGGNEYWWSGDHPVWTGSFSIIFLACRLYFLASSRDSYGHFMGFLQWKKWRYCVSHWILARKNIHVCFSNFLPFCWLDGWWPYKARKLCHIAGGRLHQPENPNDYRALSSFLPSPSPKTIVWEFRGLFIWFSNKSHLLTATEFGGYYSGQTYAHIHIILLVSLLKYFSS